MTTSPSRSHLLDSPRKASTRLTVFFSAMALLCAGCTLLAEVDNLEDRQCRVQADCRTPGHICGSEGYCIPGTTPKEDVIASDADVGDTVVVVDCGQTTCQGAQSCCVCDEHVCTEDETCCALGGGLGSACIDVSRNQSHCGACGVACGSGEACEAGVCRCGNLQTADGPVCAGGDVCCGESCGAASSCLCGGEALTSSSDLCCSNALVSGASDARHCGGCDVSCRVDQSCRQGACVCPVDAVICGGLCARLEVDPQHCGACDQACGAGEVCNGAGACARSCVVGMQSCDELCVDVQGDTANCGACGQVCDDSNGVPSCTAGACVIACDAGFSSCDGDASTGCEVDLRTDAQNCGVCTQSCASGLGCVAGTCRTVSEPVLSARHNQTCLRSAGGALHCWGTRTISDTVLQETNQATAVVAAQLSEPVEISAGENHICVLLAMGSVVCWGNNSKGQLGEGSMVEQASPAGAVSGLEDAVQQSSGNLHSCAVRKSGEVVCWGWNLYGQLGNGTTTDSSEPVVVAGITSAVEVTTGFRHSCARLADGTAQCWGQNSSGQLGAGPAAPQDQSATAIAVANLQNTTALVAGIHHTCALIDGGAVQCWGKNSNGQLGDQTTANPDSPVNVAGLDAVVAFDTVIGIAAGLNHTCAVSASGVVACWGENTHGQLGDGSQTDTLAPVAVSNLTGATHVVAGDAHSCALQAAGNIFCWGRNDAGQLGDASNSDSAAPVSVVGLP